MNELTEAGFKSLDEQAQAAFSFRERQVVALVWELDEYGDKVQRRIEIPSGPEIFAKTEISTSFLKKFLAPASAKSIIQNLVRLKAHKNYCQGEEFWNMILEDLCRDLAGCSEYAVIKACEFFRQDANLKFFPDTAALQKRIRDLDFSLRNVQTAESKTEKPAPVTPAFFQDELDRRKSVMVFMHEKGFHVNFKSELCSLCGDETNDKN